MKIENRKVVINLFDLYLLFYLMNKICFRNERNDDKRQELEFAKIVERKG